MQNALDLLRNFNSRAHVERDGKRGSATAAKLNFNSRAHVERDNNLTRYNRCVSDFNSRAHVERDASCKMPLICFAISTHALTWSATRGTISARSCQPISTHALTWSATAPRGRHGIYRHSHFNSRAHVERDMTNCCSSRMQFLFQLTRSRGARHNLG